MPHRPRKIKKNSDNKQSSITKYMSTLNATTPQTSSLPKNRTPPSVEKIESKRRNMDESMEEDRTPEVINPIGDEDLTGAKASPEEPVELTLPDMGIPKETDKNLTMEQRMEAMETRILETLKACLIPIHQELKNLRTCLDNNVERISKDSIAVKQLKHTTKSLSQNYDKLRLDNNNLQEQLNRIENKQLENTVIMHGVPEVEYKHASNRLEDIYYILADLVDHKYEPQVRLETVKEATILSTRRIGVYQRNSQRPRPISIQFAYRFDVEWVFQYKKYLRTGIYVDQAYCSNTENRRRLLCPIWKAAKNNNNYRGKCKMDGDHLVLNGRRYSTNDISTLPADLSGYTVTSKTSIDSVGFFGELNPFSNFHECNFEVNGRTYHSSEQFIQNAKANYFGDRETASRIMTCSNAFECKKESRNIAYGSMDPLSWHSVAKEKCKPGIKAKFDQNRPLMNMLLNTGNKKLIESSFDRLWGSGIPLHDDNWSSGVTSIGILGEMLMEIRDESFMPTTDEGGAMV